MSETKNIDIKVIKQILSLYGYAIEGDQPIGQGSFTVVFLGRDTIRDQVVVIKVQKDWDDRGLECEMQNTSNIPCYERIIKPINFIKSHGYKFFVCIKGEQNLQDMLMDHQMASQIDLRFAKQVGLDILLSLLTMSVEGVNHTDIKLSNILKCNDNFVLIDWASDMQIESVQYSSPYFCNQIDFELERRIEIFKSGVYLCGKSIDELCIQLKKKFTNYELECFQTINNQFLLITNPYLRFSLLEVVDQFYSFYGDKNMSAYQKYESERVIKLIDKLEEYNQKPYAQLSLYYFYLSKISPSNQQLKYLKKSFKYSKKQSCFGERGKTLQVDRALIQLELARYHLRNYDLNQAAQEVEIGLTIIQHPDEFSFTVYFQLIKCFGEILYENKNYAQSNQLIEEILKEVQTLYGYNHLLSIEMQLIQLLSLIQISIKREYFDSLKRLEKECEQSFYNHPIRAKVIIGLSKYAEKELTHYQLDMIEDAQTIYQNLYDDESIHMAELDELKSDYYFTHKLFPQALQHAQNAYNKKIKYYQDDLHPQLAKSLKRIALCQFNHRLTMQAQIACEEELKIRKNENMFDPSEFDSCYGRYIEFLQENIMLMKQYDQDKDNHFLFGMQADVLKELTDRPIHRFIDEQQVIQKQYNNFTARLRLIFQQVLTLQKSKTVSLKLDKVNWYQRKTDREEFDILKANYLDEIELLPMKNEQIKKPVNLRELYPDEIKSNKNIFVDQNKDFHHQRLKQCYQESRNIEIDSNHSMEIIRSSSTEQEQKTVSEQQTESIKIINQSNQQDDCFQFNEQRRQITDNQFVVVRDLSEFNLNQQQPSYQEEINVCQNSRDNYPTANVQLVINIDIQNQVQFHQFDQNSRIYLSSCRSSQISMNNEKSTLENYERHKKELKSVKKKPQKKCQKLSQLSQKRIVKMIRVQNSKQNAKNYYLQNKKLNHLTLEAKPPVLKQNREGFKSCQSYTTKPQKILIRNKSPPFLNSSESTNHDIELLIGEQQDYLMLQK